MLNTAHRKNTCRNKPNKSKLIQKLSRRNYIARNLHRTNTKLAETQQELAQNVYREFCQKKHLKQWIPYFDATATATNLKL